MKRKDNPSAAARIRVMKRDRFQCTYCGAPGTDVELEVDHIVAVKNGGSHHISNLTTACRSCNQEKGAKSGVFRPRNVECSRDGLVGVFLHTLKDGEIHHQGHVIAVDGDVALVELFSWMTGDPTIVKPIAKSVIYSAECRLFASAELMNAAAASAA